MPDSQKAPVLSVGNIGGAPVTTVAGLVPLVALATTNGITLPTTTEGWVAFALSILVAILGALLKHPGQ